MHFLRNTALQAIVGQTVTVVIRSNSETVETITAQGFLAEGKLFINCVPALPGKYTIAVPEDGIISSADGPYKNGTDLPSSRQRSWPIH